MATSLALPGRAAVAAAWYRRILEEIGATTRDVALTLDQG
jgi:hypothetical protein